MNQLNIVGVNDRQNDLRKTPAPGKPDGIYLCFLSQRNR